jgi:hypothetical protein
MCGLRNIGYQGDLTFECDSSLRNADCWQGPRRRWKDEIIAEPTAAMFEIMERALYVCGEQILTAYEYPVE